MLLHICAPRWDLQNGKVLSSFSRMLGKSATTQRTKVTSKNRVYRILVAVDGLTPQHQQKQQMFDEESSDSSISWEVLAPVAMFSWDVRLNTHAISWSSIPVLVFWFHVWRH